MSEKKETWTKGPWRIDGDIKTMTHGCTARPIACDDHQVAYVFVDSGKFDGDVGDANARLIAAAPALAGYVEKRAQAGDAEAVALMETIHDR